MNIMATIGLDSSVQRNDQVAGYCEHGNEHSTSIKCGKLRDCLIQY